MTQFSINGPDGLNEPHIISNPDKVEVVEAVFIWILSLFEIPVVCLTLFALCFLIKSHRAASVYVMHLILSDLLQIGFINLTTKLASAAMRSAYEYCLFVGLFFMPFIAIERYILVSHHYWYRSHHSVKMSCFIISFIIWLMLLTFAIIRAQYMFTMFSNVYHVLSLTQ